VKLVGNRALTVYDSEVDTCGLKHLKINQGSHCYILIKVLLFHYFILIKMYFEPPEYVGSRFRQQPYSWQVSVVLFPFQTEMI